MGYGSAMRNITGGSAIEWTADPANRALRLCVPSTPAKYSRHAPLRGNRVMFVYVHYMSTVAVLYLRVCMPDIYISRYGMCIKDYEYSFLRRSRCKCDSFRGDSAAKIIERAPLRSIYISIYQGSPRFSF